MGVEIYAQKKAILNDFEQNTPLIFHSIIIENVFKQFHWEFHES